MKFYSKLCCELFVLNNQIDENITSKIELDTRIKKLDCFCSEDWRRIKNLQGHLVVSYLKYRYGSPETYVLCSYADDELVYIEWLVPAKKMKRRYSFIDKNCYAVISCLTSSKYRGMNIYPSQLQEVVKSEIPAEKYYIWAEQDNFASIRGIQKTGAKKIANVVQQKYCFGFFSKLECREINS